MAKAKKKEALTPEERLQAALVPDWEQPYKVPKNWCWVRLGELSTSQYGYTAKAIKNDEYPKMLRITDIQENGVNWSDVPNCEITQDNLEKYRLSNGDIVIARTGATTGKSFLLNDPCTSVFASYLIRLRVGGKMFPKYVFNFLQTDNYWKQISELSSGIAQPGVNATKLQSLCFPLAPLPEQQRIVDRIEGLFAKLDEAKQKAQDALDSFETRKAAILHKAFTGELTARWRKEHGVGMESWDKTILKNVCKVNPKKTDTNGLPDDLEVSFFPMASLSEIYGEITEPQTRLLKDVKNGFTNFSEGDIVFAKITPCMENGKSAIIGKLVNGIGYGTTEFYVLRCSENLYNRYLYHMVRDTSFRNKAKAVMSGAVGQQRVPKSFMENYPINLPSVPEQTEIVRILDGLLAKEQQAKEAAEAVLEQIDLMKKSILARAFRGELGTNDPAEESAVELVKNII
jgi:type I restriction enzyme S subunit